MKKEIMKLIGINKRTSGNVVFLEFKGSSIFVKTPIEISIIEDELSKWEFGKSYEFTIIPFEKEVPGPEPVTIEDYLKTDPVTMAVDKCNEIFASNKLTEDLFVDRVGTQAEGTTVPYGRRNGKLYTAATLKKVEEIEARVTPKEEGEN